jgi:hypothetical protein
MSIATLTSSHTADDIPAVQRQPVALRGLLAAGLVGPVFFFIVVMVEGATRPGYSPWHHAISTLALGPGGWAVTAGLAVLGILLLCFAVGLRWTLEPGPGSTWGPIFIAISGLTFIAEAIFATDPTLGYPPGFGATTTLHGTLHNLLSVAFETPAMVAACVVLARRFAHSRGGGPWVMYSIGTVVVVVVLQVLAVLAFLSNEPDSPFGLFQRLQFFTLQGWIAVLAVRLLVGLRDTSDAQRAD